MKGILKETTHGIESDESLVLIRVERNLIFVQAIGSLDRTIYEYVFSFVSLALLPVVVLLIEVNLLLIFGRGTVVVLHGAPDSQWW